MTRDDLIIAAPWIAFVAGLSVIGFRLRARRCRARAGQALARAAAFRRLRPGGAQHRAGNDHHH
jgi:hypothetical protein